MCAVAVTVDPIERAFAAMAIREALAALPSQHRSVLIEIYYRGRSVAETAALFGLPEGTIKSRTFNAMRMLRRLLGPMSAPR
jgi:RNA polymerase sigma-70 factor, ECF subfamily